MLLRKNFDYVLLVLVVALALSGFVATRYGGSVAIRGSSPLHVPLLRSVVGVNLSVLPDSSDGGSQIVIVPSGQTPIAFVRVSAYDGDPASSQHRPMGSVNWSAGGPILPGQSVNSSSIYFQNEGNVPVRMSLSGVNWSMEDYLGNRLADSYQQYFALTWDFGDSVLQLGQAKPVIVTLSVSPDIVDVVSFSFNLAITVTPA